MEHACKRSHMLDLEDTRIIAVRLWGSQDGVVFPQGERCLKMFVQPGACGINTEPRGVEALGRLHTHA